MSLEVHLDWHEVKMAADCGVLRNVRALAMGRRSKFEVTNMDKFDAHILGALGECAYAKATGSYWNASVDTFKGKGDVGDIEVRTRSRHDYELIVRDDDPDGRVFVLVTGGPMEFKIHGWMRSEDARRPEWRREHGGYPAAYFVPHEALKNVEALSN